MRLYATEQKTKTVPVAALSTENSTRNCWIAVALGVVFLFLTCAVAGFAVKWVTMMLLLGAIAVLLWKGKLLRGQISWLTLAVALFVLMDGISTLYARSGKFALYEFLKVAAAACIFIYFVAFEPKKQQQTAGRCAAVVLEAAGALASLISIDSISTRVLYDGAMKVTSIVNASMAEVSAISGDNRINTIFENPNVFSGAIGICILLSLGLANNEEHRGWRCLHLSCTVCSSTAFLLALSRGAIAAICVAFLLLFLMECGERRWSMLLILIDAFCFAAGVAVLVYPSSFDEWTASNPKPLLLTVTAMVAVCLIEELVNGKIAERLGHYRKAANGALTCLAAACVIFVVLALNLTEPVELKNGEVLERAIVLAPGAYTMEVEAEGNLSVGVYCLTTTGVKLSKRDRLYNGGAADIAFEVPEDSEIIFVRVRSSKEGSVIVSNVSYIGTEEGTVPLHYTLIPEAVASRLQGALKTTNFVQRLVYFQDGLKLWKMSPVFGLGMGSFENAIISVQTYHYESKYAHSHYIQTLVEVGAVGFLLWLSILGTSAIAVFRMWRRKENAHPMTAACGAVLLFMMIHAAVEVDFSAGYFLPFGFGAFAVIDLCCGETLPVKQMSETAKMWVLRGEAAALGVFAVLLGMNLQAKAISQNATYESLAKAAKMDKYEWADYALSYVYSASGEENITPDMQANMDRFLPRLEAQNSNTIPFYLALTYFNLGEQEKAYEMLNKYVDYTASNSQHWEDSFQAALNYYDGSETSRAELKALYAKFNAWNEENLGTVEIPDELKELLDVLAI